MRNHGHAPDLAQVRHHSVRLTRICRIYLILILVFTPATAHRSTACLMIMIFFW
jgi:hypothetical protein